MMSQTAAINLGARKAVVCEDDDVEGLGKREKKKAEKTERERC